MPSNHSDPRPGINPGRWNSIRCFSFHEELVQPSSRRQRRDRIPVDSLTPLPRRA